MAKNYFDTTPPTWAGTNTPIIPTPSSGGTSSSNKSSGGSSSSSSSNKSSGGSSSSSKSTTVTPSPGTSWQDPVTGQKYETDMKGVTRPYGSPGTLSGAKYGGSSSSSQTKLDTIQGPPQSVISKNIPSPFTSPKTPTTPKNYFQKDYTNPLIRGLNQDPFQRDINIERARLIKEQEEKVKKELEEVTRVKREELGVTGYTTKFVKDNFNKDFLKKAIQETASPYNIAAKVTKLHRDSKALALAASVNGNVNVLLSSAKWDKESFAFTWKGHDSETVDKALEFSIVAEGSATVSTHYKENYDKYSNIYEREANQIIEDYNNNRIDEDEANRRLDSSWEKFNTNMDGVEKRLETNVLEPYLKKREKELIIYNRDAAIKRITAPKILGTVAATVATMGLLNAGVSAGVIGAKTVSAFGAVGKISNLAMLGFVTNSAASSFKDGQFNKDIFIAKVIEPITFYTVGIVTGYTFTKVQAYRFKKIQSEFEVKYSEKNIMSNKELQKELFTEANMKRGYAEVKYKGYKFKVDGINKQQHRLIQVANAYVDEGVEVKRVFEGVGAEVKVKITESLREFFKVEKSQFTVYDEGISKINEQAFTRITGEKIGSSSFYSTNAMYEGNYVELVFKTTKTGKITNMYLVRKTPTGIKNLYVAELAKVVQTPRVTKVPVPGRPESLEHLHINVKREKVFLMTGQNIRSSTFNQNGRLFETSAFKVSSLEFPALGSSKEITMYDFLTGKIPVSVRSTVPGSSQMGTIKEVKVGSSTKVPSDIISEAYQGIYRYSGVSTTRTPGKIGTQLSGPGSGGNFIDVGSIPTMTAEELYGLGSTSVSGVKSLQTTTGPVSSVVQSNPLSPNFYKPTIGKMPITMQINPAVDPLAVITIPVPMYNAIKRVDMVSNVINKATLTPTVQNVKEANKVITQIPKIETVFKEEVKIQEANLRKVHTSQIEQVQLKVDTQVKELTKQLEKTKVVQDVRVEQLLRNRIQEILLLRDRIIQRERILQRERLKQLSKERELQRQQLKQYLERLKKLTQDYRLRLNRFDIPRFNLGVGIPGKEGDEGKRGRKSRPFTTNFSYVREVRRKGKWSPGARRFETFGEAVADGISKTSKTLAASFRIKRVDKKPNARKSESDVSVAIELLRRRYYKSTKEEGVWIEKKGYRLSSKQEVEEIQEARRRSEVEKRFWFG